MQFRYVQSRYTHGQVMLHNETIVMNFNVRFIIYYDTFGVNKLFVGFLLLGRTSPARPDTGLVRGQGSVMVTARVNELIRRRMRSYLIT